MCGASSRLYLKLGARLIEPTESNHSRTKVDSGMGNGRWTQSKHAYFSQILAFQTSLSRQIADKERHWKTGYAYIELNAGSGFKVGEPNYRGTPLRAVEVVRTHFPDARFMICENDPGRYTLLTAALRAEVAERGERMDGISVRCEDFECVVPNWLSAIPRPTLGMILHDPNGAPEFEALRRMSKQPAAFRMEFVLHVNATAIKWNRRLGHAVGGLIEGLRQIEKEYWIVREPVGPWQLSLVIGTNWFPEWKREGYHSIESREGMEILTRLHFTKAELQDQRQMRLWAADD